MTTLRDDSTSSFRPAFLAWSLCFVAGFGVLGLRLAYLQVWRGDEFRHLSENNRIRLLEIHAPRGRVLDAEHRILVDNRPCFDVTAIPEEIQDYTQLQQTLSGLSPLPPETLAEKIDALRRATPFRAQVLWKDASWPTMAYLEANRLRIPGVVIQVNQARDYLFGSLLAHVIGYMGEINREELKQARGGNYRIGEWIGKAGIEKQWEQDLRGDKGGVQVEVDARGREISLLHRKEPTPGRNVVLSIHRELQEEARAAFGDHNGVAVAMDPRDGRLLCYLNLPAYDPNSFVGGIDREEWENLRTDPHHPLTNRAIQGLYPPGSVFKIVVAAAGLEEGVITPEERLFCNGYHKLGKNIFRCWRKAGHGHVDLHQALVQSCDVYFYQVGLRLGIDRIRAYAERFGLGKETGIRLAGERSGLVPSKAWKKRRYGTSWFDGETLVVAIGQGALLVTPMQLLQMIASVANGGVLWTPQLVQRLEAPVGRVEEILPQRKGSLNLSPGTLPVIRSALRDVVEGDRGTGRRARLDHIPVAGKTGTAQVIRQEDSSHDTEPVPREKQDHAWFVCYAPADDPEIAVVVLVEHGGHGGETAAPIARRIMETYFRLNSAGQA